MECLRRVAHVNDAKTTRYAVQCKILAILLDEDAQSHKA